MSWRDTLFVWRGDYTYRDDPVPGDRPSSSVYEGTWVGVSASDATRAAMQRIARRNSVVLDKEQKPSEWRVNFKSMLDGARKHPLRRTFVVGEGLPWILNPRASTPPVQVVDGASGSAAPSLCRLSALSCCTRCGAAGGT